jgi:hypothetical protein
MSERVVHYCLICSKRFEPHPRLGDWQHTCGDANCQKRRRCINSRNWRAKHPEADDAVYRRIRRRDRRAYRRNYWATHPHARLHHAAYMRQWRARRRVATPGVRDPYRDTCIKLPDINSYLQVMDVREANRVITVKWVSPKELMSATCR